MGAIIGFLGVAIPSVLILGGFIWLMEKYAGVHVTSRSQLAEAVEESNEDKQRLEKLTKSHPHLVDRAIRVCKAKHYSLTPRNILGELYKILEK